MSRSSIPLTLSISQGILWGFLLHGLLYAAVGRWREVTLARWGLAALAAGLLTLGTDAAAPVIYRLPT